LRQPQARRLAKRHDVAVTSQLPDAFRPRWWHRDLVRFPVAGAVVVGFLVLYGTAPHTVWEWPLGDSVALVMSPRGLLLGAAVIAELVILPRVSYRFRDVLWMWFPLVGAVLAVKLLFRAMLLPRRDWTPRPDELPVTVRLPGGRGQWFLARDFREAEDYRARWCRNRQHHHPYAGWEQAQAVGCRQDRPPSPADRGGSGLAG
jgi:hypothetical protein